MKTTTIAFIARVSLLLLLCRAVAFDTGVFVLKSNPLCMPECHTKEIYIRLRSLLFPFVSLGTCERDLTASSLSLRIHMSKTTSLKDFCVQKKFLLHSTLSLFASVAMEDISVCG